MKKIFKKLFFVLLVQNIHSFNKIFLSQKFFFLDLKKNRYNVFLQLTCNDNVLFDVNLGLMCFFDKKFIEVSLSAQKKDLFFFVGVKHKNCLFKVGFINCSFSISFSYLYKRFESEIILCSNNFNKEQIKLNDKKEKFNKSKKKVSKTNKQNNILPNDLMFDNVSLHSETDDFLNNHNRGMASLNFDENNKNKSNKKWTEQKVYHQQTKVNNHSDKISNEKQVITEKSNLLLELEANSLNERNENTEKTNVFIENNLETSVFQIEMQVRKLSTVEIGEHIKKFHDLNNFISSQYIKLSEYVLQEQDQKLSSLQSFLSSLRFKNFNKNNIKNNQNALIYTSVNNTGNRSVNSLQYKYFFNNANDNIEYYRKEHQNQKISLFLSVADKLKFEPYSYYENKHQFVFDLYAFEIFEIMKSTLEQNGKKLDEIINENKNIDNIKSIYTLQNLNFHEFYKELSNIASKDKIAKLWLNEFNQMLNKTKQFTEINLINFYKKVLDKCKVLLILKCLLDSQQGTKPNINFDLNKEMIDAILNLDLDCLTVCCFQVNLYKKFKEEISDNHLLVSKKFFKNNFLQKKSLDTKNKLNSKLESELDLAFKRHLKSNDVKFFNNNKNFFNKLQLYLATYNLLTQKKSNYIKESLQKKVNHEQIVKGNEQIKKKVKQNDEILNKFLDGLKEKISSKFNRDLPINDFYGTLFYRSANIAKSLKNINVGFSYEGFEIEDFLVNCLEKNGYFSDNVQNYFTYDLDFISSTFSFQKIYFQSIKKIEIFRLKFMDNYNCEYLKKIKEIVKKTKKLLKKELENKKNLFKNHRINEYGYSQNLDHILYKINFIENIVKNQTQYTSYKLLINNIIIYPNSLNFVSDWPFLTEKKKKMKLMNINNMLTNINPDLLIKDHYYTNYISNYKINFLYHLSVLNANFSSFESYTNSQVFFNQNLAVLFEEYKDLMKLQDHITLTRDMISKFKSSKMPAIDCLKSLMLSFTGSIDQILQLIIFAKLCNISLENIENIYNLMEKYKIKNLNDISKIAIFMKDEVIKIQKNLINDINLYIKNNRSYTFDEIMLNLDRNTKTLQARAFFEVFIPLGSLLTNFKGKFNFGIKLTESFVQAIKINNENNTWEKSLFDDREINDFFKYVKYYIKKYNIERIF